MAETWTKGGSPIIAHTLAGEQAPSEPSVVYDPVTGIWRMLYCAGWNNAQLFAADCIGDPTVASNWVKQGPVIGQGVGNFWSKPAHHDLVIDPQTGNLSVLFSIVPANGANIWLATSTPATWPAFEITNIPVIRTGSDDAVMGNSALFWEGGVWYNLYDASQNPAGGQIWKTYLARAEQLRGPWVKEGNVPSLQVGTGVYGGWCVRKIGNYYNAWGINGPVGQTPSYIYHHYSVEMINWGVLNGGSPVLTLTGEVADQIADPCVIDAYATHSRSFMFYDTVHNPSASAEIWVASINSPLSAICP